MNGWAPMLRQSITNTATLITITPMSMNMMAPLSRIIIARIRLAVTTARATR